MKDNYDFTGAIKNPFAGREKGKFTVKIHYDFNKNENNIAYDVKQENDKETLSSDIASKTG